MKAICVPCSGAVELGEFLPIVDHALFQRLRECRQLGWNDLVFPGARHTRFEHAIGTLARARIAARCQALLAEEKRHLEAFALLHDIGHGPFSHQIEPVLKSNHHLQGLECLREMAPQLEAAGLSCERLCAMMRGEDALAEWVSDRNLGADKLDYLQRDALHIGFVGTPDLQMVQEQTLRTEEGLLALHEKFIEEGKRIQKFYSYLHQHGYLNKTALIAQRMLQRAMQEAFAALPECDWAAEEQRIWRMTDQELLRWLGGARAPLARRLLKRLQMRTLHRTCLCIKPDGYAYVENTLGKPLVIQTWSRAALAKFSHLVQDHQRLHALEEELAALCGLRPGDLLIASMPYFKKLIPKDLRISNGGGERDYWLLEQDRDHRASLESDYLRTFALRVAVLPEKREECAAKASALADRLAAFCG